MADKHPYMSGSGGVRQAVAQLRKSFPAAVSAETLKKLEIAPNNETYVLNILRFVGVLDAENKRTNESASIFNRHDEEEFQQGFAGMVEKAYHELFALHGVGAWGLPLNKLIAFFRSHDNTSDVVGKRQASTFQMLASLSGKTNAAPVKQVRDRRAMAPRSQKHRKRLTLLRRSGRHTQTHLLCHPLSSRSSIWKNQRLLRWP